MGNQGKIVIVIVEVSNRQQMSVGKWIPEATRPHKHVKNFGKFSFLLHISSTFQSLFFYIWKLCFTSSAFQ